METKDLRFAEEKHAVAYMKEMGLTGTVEKMWVTKPRRTLWWVIR